MWRCFPVILGTGIATGAATIALFGGGTELIRPYGWQPRPAVARPYRAARPVARPALTGERCYWFGALLPYPIGEGWPVGAGYGGFGELGAFSGGFGSFGGGGGYGHGRSGRGARGVMGGGSGVGPAAGELPGSAAVPPGGGSVDSSGSDAGPALAGTPGDVVPLPGPLAPAVPDVPQDVPEPAGVACLLLALAAMAWRRARG